MEGEDASDHGGGYGSTDGNISDEGEPATPPPPAGTKQPPPPPPYRTPQQRQSARIAIESLLPPFNQQDLYNTSVAAARAQQRAAYKQTDTRPAQRPPPEAAGDAAPRT